MGLLFVEICVLWTNFRPTEGYKDSTESSCLKFLPLLTSYVVMGHVSKLRNRPWYIARHSPPDTLWIPLVFQRMVLSLV